MDQVASVAVIRNGGELLMGKRHDSGRWTLPGGGLEDGESPEDGGIRELFEEAGIRTNKLSHLASEHVKTETGKRIQVHAFKTFYDGPTTMQGDPDQEVERWQWVDIRDGLPKEVLDNLHSPKNVALRALGIQKGMFSLLKGGPGSGRKGHRTYHQDEKKKRTHKIPEDNTGGDCYESAVKHMMDHYLLSGEGRKKDDMTLVQAEVTGQGPISGMKYGHSWVERGDTVYDKSNGRDIEIPKSIYYAIGKISENPKKHHRYTWDQVKKKIHENGHYGPWELETESGKSMNASFGEIFKKSIAMDLAYAYPKAAHFLTMTVGKRGGKIIGKTKSGKPIYEPVSKLYSDTPGERSPAHKFKMLEYTKEDHEDAARFHRDQGNVKHASFHEERANPRTRIVTHIGGPALVVRSDTEFVIDLRKAAIGRMQHKYLRRYRRGGRWQYVYQKPEHERGHAVSEQAAEILREFAEAGHVGVSQIQELSSAKLDDLRELADAGHLGSKDQLYNLGIDRITERIEESLLPESETSSRPITTDPVLDRRFESGDAGNLQARIREIVNNKIFSYLSEYRTSRYAKKLVEHGITLSSVMNNVRGDSLREVLESLHDALKPIDQAHEGLSETQNTEARDAGGYGNLAYNSVIKKLENLPETSKFKLPQGYSDVHDRGGEIPGTAEIQEAIVRREREREERERAETVEREERLAREARELEGSMAHFMASVASSSYQNVGTMQQLDRAFTNIFGRRMMAEDWPYDFEEHGYRVKIDSMNISPNGVSMSLSAMDRDGRPVTNSWSRSFSLKNGKPHIYNSYLVVNSGARNADQPIGQLINFSQQDMLKTHGSGKIEVSASLDVGGYNWANQGFSFQSSSAASSMRGRFGEFLARNGISLTDEELTLFTQPCHFANFDDGKKYDIDLARAIPLSEKQKETRSLVGKAGEHSLFAAEIEAGETTRMRGHLGKKFLLGKSWNGVVKVSQMNDRNDAYRLARNYRQMRGEAWKLLSEPYKSMIEKVMAGERPLTVPVSARTTMGAGGTITPISTRSRSRVTRPRAFRSWPPSQQTNWIEMNSRHLTNNQRNSARALMGASRSQLRASSRDVSFLKNSGFDIPENISDYSADYRERVSFASTFRPRVAQFLKEKAEENPNFLDSIPGVQYRAEAGNDEKIQVATRHMVVRMNYVLREIGESQRLETFRQARMAA